MVQLKKKRHPVGVCEAGPRTALAKTVGSVNRLVERLMCLAQVRRHGNRVVEVGERSFGMCGADFFADLPAGRQVFLQ
jgi:hypothetical protein